MSKEEYTSKDIVILSDREHVHKRMGMYTGNTNQTSTKLPTLTESKFNITTVDIVPAILKLFNEILDNCVDELRQQPSKKLKLITIEVDEENDTYTIADNGRGVPIEKHESGNYTPEVVFGSLRSGRNFSDEKTAGVIGMNGMGSAIVNFCSKLFQIEINRDGKVYKQTYSNCANDRTPANISKSSSKETGTSIKYCLEPSLFKETTKIDINILRNRAIEVAFNNPGVTVKFQNETFSYKNGLQDLLSNFSKQFFKFEIENIDFYVVFDSYNGLDEQVFTWVNSSLLYDGGICNTQFMNAFNDKVISYLQPQAKKLKCEVTKNDIRQNLLVLACLQLERPEYDAQSKTRLTGPNLKKTLTEMIENNWKSFCKTNKEWLEEVLKTACLRHDEVSEKNAVKAIAVTKKKKIPGLIDASNKNRYECILAITEGLSASSMISEVRDPSILGVYPLTGKINNVYGCKPSELLKMPKIINLLQAIGLVPGQRAKRASLNYGQIWISTDADPDGDDICSLLVNMIFQFWPELFESNGYPPFIKRLIAPNVVAYKGKKRKHFVNRALYEKEKSKYEGWSIEYYKGLGSMIIEDWQQILYDDAYQLSIVDTDNSLSNILKLLFDEKADNRKLWLSTTSDETFI